MKYSIIPHYNSLLAFIQFFYLLSIKIFKLNILHIMNVKESFSRYYSLTDSVFDQKYVFQSFIYK